MKGYRQIPLQRKILAACLAVILIPLTVLVVLILERNMQEERSRTTISLTQANEVIDDRLSTIVKHIKTTSAMYLVYPDVIQDVKNDFHMDQPNYIATMRELRKNVMSARINPYVSSITYLSNQNHAFSGAGYNESYLNSIQGFAREMEEKDVKNMMSPVYETAINQQSVRTITYGFALVDTYTFEHVGYAFINLDLKQFEQNFKVFTQDANTDTLALQGNQIVYQGERISRSMTDQIIREMGKMEGQVSQIRNTVIDFRLLEGDYRAVSTYNEALDITIVSIAANRVLKIRMMQGMIYYLVIVVIVIAVFIGVSILLSIKLTKPIRVLEEGMRQVENGKLVPITRELGRQDDLGNLINGFNDMVVRLNESIAREYESKNLQKKAQIMMLESQINPHFLYNTLNVINSIAVLEEVPEISKLATSLGDMFRYNINGKSLVTVREEITQIQRYAEIQRLCIASEIEMIYSVTPEVEEKQVLKFLLQPLVENCFEHGFSRKIQNGFIKVQACLLEETVVLCVEDNGVGISQVGLNYLLPKCREHGASCLEKEDNDSIGLLNVNFRLKNYYGEEYGLIVESEEGRGTKITIRIPENCTKS